MKRVHSLTHIAAVGSLTILLSVGFSNAMRYEAVKKLVPQTHSLIEGAKADERESNQLALIVDDSNYPDAEAPLDQTAHDATGLAAALNGKGFSVDLLANGTRAQTLAATERLKAKVRPGSTVLVYFRGYAIQSRGKNYMIPVDAKIWDEADVRHEGLSIDELLSTLKALGAHTRLVAIDASRRNPYERRFRSYSHGLAPIQPSEAEAILTSAAPNVVVDDFDELKSRFMATLVQQISSSTRPIAEIFEKTSMAWAAALRTAK
ncbi:caspase family protein [Bradyrhizobium sp. WSM1743]|uniref:caspase family protein n=1 Tax=Bradyrhizobium sp. WSM1743 TaxID=318996 RepID=UPI0012EB2385|nr:caspase family protein [Bradyrhizobium sp. WSM1743]